MDAREGTGRRCLVRWRLLSLGASASGRRDLAGDYDLSMPLATLRRGVAVPRWMAAGFIIVLGCGGRVLGVRESADEVAPVVGQYVFLECSIFGGDSPSCTDTDSLGTIVTIVDGELRVGLTPPGDVYEWYLTTRSEHSDGASEQVSSLFSSGHFTWDGETVQLDDDEGNLGENVGTLSASNGRLTVVTETHRYEFGRLVLLPPGS